MAKLNYYGIHVNEWTPARFCELEPRAMRRKVSEFNDLYGTDENHKYYIISGMNGYKLTRNIKEIRDQIAHDERIAKRELETVSNRRKNLERMEKVRRFGGLV